MWWGPMGYGWGMPFVMFLFPLFFFICIGIMFYFFRRGSCPFGYHNHDDAKTNKELLQEVRKLRQEIELLKTAKNSKHSEN